MADDTERKVIDFLSHLKDKGIDAPVLKEPKKVKIKGNNNVVGDNNKVEIITTQKISKTIAPPNGTIGASMVYKSRINELANQLKKIWAEKSGNSYASAENSLKNAIKKEFGLSKNVAWREAVWLLPESQAESVIAFIQALFNKTQVGRIKNARDRDKTHTKSYLMKMETELLAQIGLTPRSEELRQFMKKLYGVTSHLKLSTSEQNRFYALLEKRVEQVLTGEKEGLLD